MEEGRKQASRRRGRIRLAERRIWGENSVSFVVTRHSINCKEISTAVSVSLHSLYTPSAARVLEDFYDISLEKTPCRSVSTSDDPRTGARSLAHFAESISTSICRHHWIGGICHSHRHAEFLFACVDIPDLIGPSSASSPNSCILAGLSSLPSLIKALHLTSSLSFCPRD